MCLGVPMEVLALEGDRARCCAHGTEREVSLLMLQDDPVAVGDFVLVYSGHATQKLTSQQARETWELYEQAVAGQGDGLPAKASAGARYDAAQLAHLDSEAHA